MFLVTIIEMVVLEINSLPFTLMGLETQKKIILVCYPKNYDRNNKINIYFFYNHYSLKRCKIMYYNENHKFI